MKSPNETNVGVNETDPVNAIIDHNIPNTVRTDLAEVQRAAVLRFCEVVEAADHVYINSPSMTSAYWTLKHQLAAAQQEKK